MSFYHKLGILPEKKHTTFFKEDGKSLYREELCSTKGFSGIYSTKYHINMPTSTLKVEELESLSDKNWQNAPLSYYHFFTDKLQTKGNYFTSRNEFLHNSHCVISTSHPTENTDFFFRNSYAHEFVFVHFGSGSLISEYGILPFIPGDQIVIPQGTTYQMEFDSFENNKLVIIESDTPYDIPKHYRNEYGQILEDAPYCERDFKIPSELKAIDKKGEFELIIKARHRLFKHTIDHHPFDLVGWDGYLYPYSFNIKDYAPKVGKLHLPPPVHLLFTTQHFVVCNFCPRLFDFHPQSIPAPYFHTNIDSAEVLYYIEGDFMSRKGVGTGSITLHPLGLPHGPQPGKTEQSVGAKETYEYALMVDTFDPFELTTNVKETMDENYFLSWIE
ncbi:MAG: hmgA [Ignavibacteria bacterium]|nr:hmgA [Ignavibacteria bacterium]